MLGISVYLSEPIEQQAEHIHHLKKIGFQSIFTSLHIPEDNPSIYKERLIELGDIAKKIQMELVADISPKSLHYLGYTWDSAHELQKWGVTGLRVDYGVEEKNIAELSQKMKVALNASTITKESLTLLKSMGVKLASVEAWHNFYPRPETGLDRLEFVKKNQWLRSEGIKVMAFVPGDESLRGPLYKGLPTLEEHRYQSPFVAFYDLNFNGEVDKILVGDRALRSETVEQFYAYNKDECVLLRANAITADEEILRSLETPHTNRWDSARDCIRSVESREYGLMGHLAQEPFNTVKRDMGAITIDNKYYGRYQGEIQITKRDLAADEKVNVIGKVIAEDIPMLSLLKGGATFKIKWV